jgi:hypothetical protein
MNGFVSPAFVDKKKHLYDTIFAISAKVRQTYGNRFYPIEPAASLPALVLSRTGRSLHDAAFFR